jgi:ParB-like chromosome segregation protein Spo0J
MSRSATLYQHVIRGVDDLLPIGKNARLHSDAQLAKLTKAIKAFGFTCPLLIDENNGVIAGSGRLAAARDVPLTHVPCIVVPGLTPAQKSALAISDNRLPLESSWNQTVLIETLGEISADGFDLQLSGFDQFEVDSMLFPSPFDDPDEFTEPKAERAPSITIVVPNSINIPSVAAVVRKAISTAGFKGIRVKEPK